MKKLRVAPPKDSCANCRFSFGAQGSTELICRKNPPRAIFMGTSTGPDGKITSINSAGIWPSTHPSLWCGAHEVEVDYVMTVQPTSVPQKQ